MKPGLKNNALRVINLILYLGGCFVLGTGLMLAYRMPHGRDSRGMTVLGLDRHEWGDWHLWIGLIVAVAMVLHLALNWAWLKKIATSRKVIPLAGGLGAGLALVTAGLLLPVKTVSAPDNHRQCCKRDISGYVESGETCKSRQKSKNCESAEKGSGYRGSLRDGSGWRGGRTE